MDEKMIRAFLAIDPPEEILREIGRIQERLQQIDPRGGPLGPAGGDPPDAEILRRHPRNRDRRYRGGRGEGRGGGRRR